MTRRLVVIGAGISGLAAARTAADRARERNEALEVVVLERDAEVGGKVRTYNEGGWRVETGPTAYLDNEPDADELAERVGLTSERVVADEAAADRFVVRGGVMRSIPLHPLKFARAGILGPWGLLNVALDVFRRGKRDETDESVWAFARRRLGRQAADRLIAPMVIGVFAGDAKRLSLPAAFPRMAALEREYGSLIRGMIAKRREAGSGGPGGQLVSFRSGLQTLPITLAGSGGLTVRCVAVVDAVRPVEGGGWTVHVQGDAEPIPADAVVLAGEAWSMAALIDDHAPDVAAPLCRIPYPHVSVVALGFGAEGLERVPCGFGVLIPRGERYRMLGVLWDSYFFPERSPDGHLLIRAMVGGAVDADAAALDEDALAALVRDEVRQLFGLDTPPVFTKVARWDRAIPQYELGHLNLVGEVERALQQRPGLFMAGNALHGVAFAKAAAAGVTAGEAAAAFMSRGDRVG